MLLTGLLGKTGVVVLLVVVVCVCVGGGGGDEAISKLKGAGATRALLRLYLHVPAYRGLFSKLPHYLKQTPTVSL